MVRAEGGSSESCLHTEKPEVFLFPKHTGAPACWSLGRAEAWLQQARNENEVRLALWDKDTSRRLVGLYFCLLNKMRVSFPRHCSKTKLSTLSSLQKHNQVSLLCPGRTAAAWFDGRDPSWGPGILRTGASAGSLNQPQKQTGSKLDVATRLPQMTHECQK